MAVLATELEKGDVFVHTMTSGSPGFEPSYQESDRVEWIARHDNKVRVKVWRKGKDIEFELVYLARPLIRRTEEYEPNEEERAEREYDERHDPGNRTGWEGH